MARTDTDQALELIDESGSSGLTWRRVADMIGLGHGQASGILSRLHRQGKIARLAEEHDGSAVYVLPAHVNDRATIEYNARGRGKWSPDHPCFDGRPILLGDTVQYSDAIKGGRWSEGTVREIRWLGDEPVIEVVEAEGWLVSTNEILGHTPKRS